MVVYITIVMHVGELGRKLFKVPPRYNSHSLRGIYNTESAIFYLSTAVYSHCLSASSLRPIGLRSGSFSRVFDTHATMVVVSLVSVFSTLPRCNGVFCLLGAFPFSFEHRVSYTHEVSRRL